MHNWSCDLRRLRKRSKEGARIFLLEQRINYGLGRTKLARRELVNCWGKLRLDPQRRRFLSFLLWNRQS